MLPSDQEYGVDRNVTNTIVGFKLEGEVSPNDAILAPSSTDGTSPLPHNIMEPPAYMMDPRGYRARTSGTQVPSFSNPPSRAPSNASGGISSNLSSLSNISHISNMSALSAGTVPRPLVSHTSLPQPPTTTPATPLADPAPPATLSAPNSPPTGAPTDLTAKSAAPSPAPSSTAPSTPSSVAASSSSVATSSASARPPSEAELAAMSKAERKAYHEARRPKEAAAKLSKEERRAKQEAERAQKAKQAGKAPPSIASSTTTTSSSASSSAKPALRTTPTKPAPPSSTPAGAPTTAAPTAPAPAPKKPGVEIISHLVPSLDLGSDAALKALRDIKYHDDILHLGWRFQKGLVMGGTARTLAMLKVLTAVVNDYRCPDGKEPARDIAAHISHQVGFLAAVRRPLGLHMGNAVRHLKSQIGKMRPGLPEPQVKAEVRALIEKFEEERIRLPLQQITQEAVRLIEPGDHIVTFCRSEAVLRTLIQAHKTMSADKSILQPPFTVGVVDNSETQEGRRTLEVLLEHGLDVVYDCSVSFSASAMSRATKLLLGAAAVHANGAVYTRSGAMALALEAKFQGTPVLVLCETFKFHERHQVSPTAHNELGDPERGLLDVPEHAPRAYKANEAEAASEVATLSLRYCLIPPACVDMIVCEAAAVPPAGVVAQMRGHRKDAGAKQ